MIRPEAKGLTTHVALSGMVRLAVPFTLIAGTGLTGRTGITSAEIVYLILFYKILCVVFRTRKRVQPKSSWAVARNTFYRPTET